MSRNTFSVVPSHAPSDSDEEEELSLAEDDPGASSASLSPPLSNRYDTSQFNKPRPSASAYTSSAASGSFKAFLFNACLSEFLGSAMLCYVALAAVYTANVMADDAVATGSLAMIAVAYGLSYGCLLYTFSLSGGGYVPSIRQLNPCLSITLYLSGKLDLLKTSAFILSQCAGAVVGSSVLYLCMSSAPLRIFELMDSVNIGQQIGMSAIVCFLFFLVETVTNFAVISPTIQSNISPDLSEQSPQTVHELNCIISGFICVAGTAVGNPITGCFMNPLVGVSVFILSIHRNSVIVCIFGPLIGACVAALAARLFTYRTRPPFTANLRYGQQGGGVGVMATQMTARTTMNYPNHGDRF